VSNQAEFPWMGNEEIREREAVYYGWREVRMPEGVEEQEGLVDRFAGRNPGWWTGPTPR
jgi:hypothetical protein